MELHIYQPPEDEEGPMLRIYSEEKDPVIVQYTEKQRDSYRRPLYISPWDPADTL